MSLFLFFRDYINGTYLFCPLQGGTKMSSETEIISKFDTYIKKSLKNELRHCIRDAKRERDKVVSFSNLTKSEENTLYISEEYPSEKFEEKIETELFDVIIRDELLYEVLKKLKPKSRNIILLKYWFEMTDYEVGQLLDMKRDAVVQHRNRTLSNLKRKIEEMQNDDA